MTDGPASLDAKARFYGWATLLGIALALIWFFSYVSGLLALVSRGFGITDHEFAVINYGGIGLLKLLVYTFYGVPWLGTKIEQRRRKNP